MTRTQAIAHASHRATRENDPMSILYDPYLEAEGYSVAPASITPTDRAMMTIEPISK
jgi:hypothetical protein